LPLQLYHKILKLKKKLQFYFINPVYNISISITGEISPINEIQNEMGGGFSKTIAKILEKQCQFFRNHEIGRKKGNK
jgi:hypothetical protein